MRTKFLATALVVLIAGLLPVSAAEKPNGWAVAADVVFVRPVGVVSTAVGGALFVLSLPVTAATKSVKPVGDALVNRPAKATFKRQLGDLDSMAD